MSERQNEAMRLRFLSYFWCFLLSQNHLNVDGDDTYWRETLETWLSSLSMNIFVMVLVFVDIINVVVSALSEADNGSIFMHVEVWYKHIKDESHVLTRSCFWLCNVVGFGQLGRAKYISYHGHFRLGILNRQRPFKMPAGLTDYVRGIILVHIQGGAGIAPPYAASRIAIHRIIPYFT